MRTPVRVCVRVCVCDHRLCAVSPHVCVCVCVTQVVYSEPMGAMRASALVGLGQYSEACSALTVTYDCPDNIRRAPWRMWLAMQAKYMSGDMQVRWLYTHTHTHTHTHTRMISLSSSVARLVRTRQYKLSIAPDIFV